MTLTLLVLNANDNAPRFNQQAYVFNVAEGSSNVEVGTISGNDADNDRISYRLETTQYVYNYPAK